jgi:hypothetical protein
MSELLIRMSTICGRKRFNLLIARVASKEIFGFVDYLPGEIQLYGAAEMG